MKTRNINRIIEKAFDAYSNYHGYCEIIAQEAQKYVEWCEVHCEYYHGDGICVSANINGSDVVVAADKFFVYVKQTIGNAPISKDEFIDLTF